MCQTEIEGGGPSPGRLHIHTLAGPEVTSLATIEIHCKGIKLVDTAEPEAHCAIQTTQPPSGAPVCPDKMNTETVGYSLSLSLSVSLCLCLSVSLSICLSPSNPPSLYLFLRQPAIVLGCLVGVQAANQIHFSGYTHTYLIIYNAAEIVTNAAGSGEELCEMNCIWCVCVLSLIHI